jgi:hypothetical protein
MVVGLSRRNPAILKMREGKWRTRRDRPAASRLRLLSRFAPLSAPSTLAASILKRGEEIGLPNIDPDLVGDWIRGNTRRTNILLADTCGIKTLTLLESFLQCKLDPVFEGFVSQK